MKKAGIAADGTRPDMMLMHGSLNNYPEWKQYMGLEMAEKFGYLANVIQFDAAYVPPPILEIQWNPPADPGGPPPFPAAERLKIRVSLELERNKEIANLKANHPSMFAALIKGMSPTSFQIVESPHWMNMNGMRSRNQSIALSSIPGRRSVSSWKFLIWP